MSATTVAVVIPYLKDLDELRACLDKVLKQTLPPSQTIIVDNGSGQASSLKISFPIEVIGNASNLGFSVAVNQGLAQVTGDYLLVLNSDVLLNAGYIEACVATLESFPDAAGVTGKLLKQDGKTIDSTGHVLYGDRRVADRGEFTTQTFDRDEEVFSIPATAALYRVEDLRALHELQGEAFDEDFFMYGEDVDVAWRLRLLGKTLRYTPSAEALHQRRISAGPRPALLVAFDQQNRRLRMVKVDTARSLLIHLPEIILTEIRLFIYFIVRQPSVLWISWRGFFAGFRSALRKRRKIDRRASAIQIEPWFERYDYLGVLRRLFR